MKRPKFVRVVTVPLPRAGTSIPGIRREDDVLPVGSVVPIEWFQEVPDSVFVHLINPSAAGGLGVIVEHVPDTKEMELLKVQYPSLFPDNAISPMEVKKATRAKKTEEEGE